MHRPFCHPARYQELAKRDSLFPWQKSAGRRIISFAFTGRSGDLGALRGPARLQYGEAEGYGPAREWLSEDFSRRKGLSIQPRYSADHGYARPSICWSGCMWTRAIRCWWRTPPHRDCSRSLRLQGAVIVPVEGDQDGILPEHLEAMIRRQAEALGAPNFTNPTGVMWSLGGVSRCWSCVSRMDFLSWRTILTAIFILRTPRIRSPEFLPSSH